MSQSDAKEKERFYVRIEAADAKSLEDAILEWINELRAARGLPPMKSGDEKDAGESDGQ